MRLEYFQMVDRILSLDPDTRLVRARAKVPDASPVFEGHFPGYPLLPGVLMIETMAQTGGWLLMALQRFSRIPLLGQVKEAKMRAFVSPGETLETEASLVHDGSGYAVVNGRIQRDGKPVADAELTYRVMPFPNPGLRDQMLATARRIAVPESFFDDA